MKTRSFYLIVPVDGRTPRVVYRRPYDLKNDEIAHRLNIKYPDAWGRIQVKEIDVELPAPPEAVSGVERVD